MRGPAGDSCNGHSGMTDASSRQGRPTPLAGNLVGPRSYATVVSAVQRNAVLSAHMRCSTTASLRATATLAFFCPTRLASRTPQAFSADQRCTRDSRVVAASNR